MSKILLALIPLIFGTLALAVLTDFSYYGVLLSIENIHPLDWHAVGTAIFCGALIGWERMMRNKVLGIRTSIFIILGTYMFSAIATAVVGQAGYSELGPIADPTRAMSAIITGIGFLGAGVMWLKDNKVSGVTTAATIWLLATLGICIGSGFLSTAIVVTVMGTVILIVVNEIDAYIVRFTKYLVKNKKFVPRFRVCTVAPVEGDLFYVIEVQQTRFGTWEQYGPDTYTTHKAARVAMNTTIGNFGYSQEQVA